VGGRLICLPAEGRNLIPRRVEGKTSRATF